MALIRRKCAECGTKYDVLQVQGEEMGLDEDEPWCVACHSYVHTVVATAAHTHGMGCDAGIGRDYPYFDRGLRCWVRDAQHHTWLLEHWDNGQKREIAMEPTEGEYDPEAEYRKDELVAEQEEAEFREDWDRMMSGEQRADYHKALEVISELPADWWKERQSSERKNAVELRRGRFRQRQLELQEQHKEARERAIKEGRCPA